MKNLMALAVAAFALAGVVGSVYAQTQSPAVSPSASPRPTMSPSASPTTTLPSAAPQTGFGPQ